MEKIRLFNTLGRKLDDFVPINAGKVGIYTCGPTVYGRAHIGNLKTYIFADLLRRMFEYAGFKVKQVMNITDVGHLTSDADEGEDKLQKAARENKQISWEISRKWTKYFFEDTKKLNIKIPNIICKATDHIPEQIKLIQKLEEKGYTYKTSDGIYFDTSKFSSYGDFAKLDMEGLQAGKRIDLGEKKNKTDFALWKFSKPNEKRDLEWDSPWGVGFPGWHIECSAMSMKYLGEHFDIHTGGIDHIPIHHTNEIAQSECATGHKFVNYWLHSEFLVMNENEKMSKSLGNVLNLDSLKEKGITPLDYRYFCLNTHYRKQLSLSKEALDSAKTAHENLVRKFNEFKSEYNGETLDENNNKYIEKFKKAIYNDLNIPQSLGIMWNMIKDPTIDSGTKYLILKNFDRVLGLDLEKSKVEIVSIPDEIQKLIDERQKARDNKDWAKADELRNKIKSMGYEVKDKK